MNRIILTGATGFIGKHCIQPLLAKGFELHGISSQIAPSERNFEPNPNIEWHQVDLLDVATIARLMPLIQPTHLLHLAWCVTPGAWATSIDNFTWVQASLELVRQFYEAGGRRAVLVGSDYEYDVNFGFCSEHLTPLQPSTFYGACKVGLNSLVAAYAHRTELSLAWARFFSLYGPHEHPNRLVSSVIRSLLKQEPAHCSHGQQIRDFLYVQDAADALVTLLDSEMTGSVNIASGQPTALKTVVSAIAKKLQREDLVYLGALPARPNEVPLLVADVRRLTNDLRWQPKFSLDEGIGKTIEWWQHHLDHNCSWEINQ